MGDSKSVEVSNDPSSHFYIHHSNTPRMHLVSTLLIGYNYSTWSRLMHIALSANNKFGFVDRFVKKLSDKKATEAALAMLVVYAETAHVVWEDLKTRFFARQRLWDELSSYGNHKNCLYGAMEDRNEKEEQNKVMQFLMGLDDSYIVMRGQIMLVKPLPSVLKVFSMVSQEEKQRGIAAIPEPSVEGAAMAVQGGRGNQHNHGSQRNRKPLHCDYCDMDHHTRETCYWLHGYPEDHRLHKKNKGKSRGKEGKPATNHVLATTSSTSSFTSTTSMTFTPEQLQQLFAMMAGNLPYEAQTNAITCLSSHHSQ
nr:uncharacterized protein LOC103403653 [Malus domestica]